MEKPGAIIPVPPKFEMVQTIKGVRTEKLKNSESVQEIFRLIMSEKIGFKMEAHAIYLNRALKGIGTYKICEGGISRTHIDVSLVLSGGLLLNASAFAVGVNYPSGQKVVDNSCIHTAKLLCAAGAYVGLKMVDFIVISGSDDSYISLADQEIVDFADIASKQKV